MNYEAIDDERIAEFRAAVVSGITRDIARQMLYELERAERERGRLELQSERDRAGRMAIRENVFDEMEAMRKRIAELECAAKARTEIPAKTVTQENGDTSDLSVDDINEMRSVVRDAAASGFDRVLIHTTDAMSVLDEVAEERAWMKVASDSNSEVDAYLRTVDPTLPTEYGMPADGVRYVVERLKERGVAIEARYGCLGCPMVDGKCPHCGNERAP